MRGIFGEHCLNGQGRRVRPPLHQPRRRRSTSRPHGARDGPRWRERRDRSRSRVARAQCARNPRRRSRKVTQSALARLRTRNRHHCSRPSPTRQHRHPCLRDVRASAEAPASPSLASASNRIASRSSRIEERGNEKRALSAVAATRTSAQSNPRSNLIGWCLPQQNRPRGPRAEPYPRWRGAFAAPRCLTCSGINPRQRGRVRIGPP